MTALEVTEEMASTALWLLDAREAMDADVWPADDETRLAVWLNLKTIQQDIGQMVKELTADIAASHKTGDRIEYQGEIAEVRWSSRRVKWKQDELRSDIRRHILFDPETGDMRPANEVLELRDAIHPLNGSCRMAKLKEMGFDTDEYREKSSVPGLSVVS